MEHSLMDKQASSQINTNILIQMSTQTTSNSSFKLKGQDDFCQGAKEKENNKSLNELEKKRKYDQ